MPSDTNSKKGTPKSDFFRIDSEGEITPIGGPKHPEGRPENTGVSRIEPLFQSGDLGPLAPEIPPADAPDWNNPTFKDEPLAADPVPHANDNTATGVGKIAPATPKKGGANFEVQADLMKTQVDSISRLSTNEAVSSNQVDVLRKYISLKEAEAKDLKEQLRQTQGMLQKLTHEMGRATNAITDRGSMMESMKIERDSLRQELQDLKDRYRGDLSQVRSEMEEKLRSTGKLDSDVEALYRQKEEWKERIKDDLKKIKLKEREIETKHELLKRDMQALLDSKDKHLLELRKKCDALEFEQENLEDRLRKSTFVLSSIDSKKKRLIETMRLAISLLEKVDSTDEYTSSDDERKAG